MGRPWVVRGLDLDGRHRRANVPCDVILMSLLRHYDVIWSSMGPSGRAAPTGECAIMMSLWCHYDVMGRPVGSLWTGGTDGRVCHVMSK